jgi:hypothetical protein
MSEPKLSEPPNPLKNNQIGNSLRQQLVEGGLLLRRPLPRQARVVPERCRSAPVARVCSSPSAAAAWVGTVLRRGARRRRVAVGAHTPRIFAARFEKVLPAALVGGEAALFFGCYEWMR